MTVMLNRRLLFAGASGLFLAGCADIVGPPPAPKLYVLEPVLPGPLPGPKVKWALSVEPPSARAGLDSERIAVMRPPSGLDYFADAAWADRLPLLAEAALIEAFEGSGRIGAVARDSDGALADYVLVTDLRDFGARYDAGEGAPLAVVRLSARIVYARTRAIAGSTIITKEVRASANSVVAGVAALTAAYGAVLGEVVPWVLDRSAPAA